MEQNQNSYSVQRRTPDFEDYIDIVRRHKMWILGPAFVGVVAAVITAFLWSDTYVSAAVIKVVPSQVPEKLVPTNVTAQMSERINSMVTSILSRATLTNIVTSYNLYPNERNRRPMEDIIEDMRKDLNISGVQMLATRGPQRDRAAAAAFQVAFRYQNRFLAQRVTQDVVTRIIDENLRLRSAQSVMTTDFLKDQVEQAKRDYDEIDKKLTEFRMRNVGQTPEEMQMNYQQLSAKEMRITNLNAAVSRLHQEKMQYEADLRAIRDRIKALASLPPEQVASMSGGRNDRLVQLERQITTLETTLGALRERYQETHPDIQTASANLGVLRRQRDELTKQEEVNKPAETPEVRINPAVAKDVMEFEASATKIQGIIQAKEFEIEEMNREVTSLMRSIKTYQARIESSPVGRQEYMQLIEQRELARQKYESLAMKKSQSELATDLEARNQGEKLELLDPASLPQSPTEPNRWLIVSAGSLVGLMIGFVVAGVREVKDTSLKNLKDVRAYTQLTILGSVPLLENDLVIRHRRRMAWLGWSTAILVGMILVSGSVYYYLFVQRV